MSYSKLRKNFYGNKFLNIVKNLADDQTASLVPFLYPTLQEVELNPKTRDMVQIPIIAAGTRINWYGNIYRVMEDIEDIVENNPDNAPALWEEIKYKNGYHYIDGETVFIEDECGWFGNNPYRSLIDYNLTNPETNPENWEMMEEQF